MIYANKNNVLLVGSDSKTELMAHLGLFSIDCYSLRLEALDVCRQIKDDKTYYYVRLWGDWENKTLNGGQNESQSGL